MPGRAYDPIKSGATKSLPFSFLDDDNEPIAMESATVTIVDQTGQKIVDAVACMIVDDSTIEYQWTAPAVSKPKHCRVEFVGVEALGSQTRKSGADGRGDYTITILPSLSS